MAKVRWIAEEKGVEERQVVEARVAEECRAVEARVAEECWAMEVRAEAKVQEEERCRVSRTEFN